MAKAATRQRKTKAKGGSSSGGYRLFNFERYSDPLASTSVFYRRLTINGVTAIALVLTSLFVGMAGYHFIAGLEWIDAFQNAAMILSGMGPVDELHSNGAKLFAGIYAIYSGLALIATAGVTIAPILHRVLHRLHLEDEGDEE
ncbi:MAG TPA: hypothetical protein VHA70_09395 [Bauldia sp.]|nr:hypothetical protein [Bauldia sp.]